MIHVTEIVASKDIMLIENNLIEIQSTLHIIHRIIHSDTQWNPRDFVEGKLCLVFSVFGVASMVHSGLNFAYFFQVRDGNAQCHHPVQAIKPFMHLTFTFTQLYFIFLHSKVE